MVCLRHTTMADPARGGISQIEALVKDRVYLLKPYLMIEEVVNGGTKLFRVGQWAFETGTVSVPSPPARPSCHGAGGRLRRKTAGLVRGRIAVWSLGELTKHRNDFP